MTLERKHFLPANIFLQDISLQNISQQNTSGAKRWHLTDNIFCQRAPSPPLVSGSRPRKTIWRLCKISKEFFPPKDSLFYSEYFNQASAKSGVSTFSTQSKCLCEVPWRKKTFQWLQQSPPRLSHVLIMDFRIIYFLLKYFTKILT